jgi:hypothetical protein
MAGGSAWAQSAGGFMPGTGNRPNAGAGRNGVVDLNAVPDLSIEGRNSAGVFGSDADDFISPTAFGNLDLGGDTFLFVGADIPGRPANVDVGLAKELGGLYLGLYYGGALANAVGDGDSGTSAEPDAKYRLANWDSNLAVLLGLGNMGFRLDVVVPSRTETESVDGVAVYGPLPAQLTLLDRTVANGPSFALTWGMDAGDLSPWVRLGYRFPSVTLSDYEITLGALKTTAYSRLTSDAAIEVSGGAEYALGEGSAVGGALRFGSTFPTKQEQRETATVGTTRPNATNTSGGMIGLGIEAYYSRVFDYDVFAIGFRPNAGFWFTSASNSWEGDSGSLLVFGDRYTTLELGVGMGMNWRLGERTRLFTGADMRFLDWTTWAETGETYVEGADNAKARLSSWRFSGVSFQNPTVGMTFTPVENVVLGLALNNFIQGLFGSLAGFPSIDFTVSAKLGG